ncbi:MAG: GtrA family protein [Paracoccaceae bacterium]
MAQLLKFASVGAVATVLHVGVALAVSSFFGFAPQLANALGFASAVTLSYFGQGRFTFAQDLRHRFHAPRFLATALTGLVVSSGFTALVTSVLSAPFPLAMAAVAVAVPATTYVLCKFWVFRPEGDA